ncbi:MAG: RluA family pseudouridine synthase [Treponema sp.]|nr:RluA family pseudouridine synthase [Treponema sp.]
MCFLLKEKLDKKIPLPFIHLPDEFGFETNETETVFGQQKEFSGMFGVLVCRTVQGKTVVLKAFSGQYKSRWMIPGWVPPLLVPADWAHSVQKRDAAIHELSYRIATGTDQKKNAVLKKERRELSTAALKEIYGLYKFYCADGCVRDFSDLTDSKLLPTGVGDCCAPKLLSFAYHHELQPESLAEFFYGKETAGARIPEHFYPPCDEKCSFILPSILGLRIIYRDEYLVVVDKPSGLLSVPGRGPEKQDCVVTRLQRLFPQCMRHPSVHRLDQETSGLMVLALQAEVQRALSLQFQNRQVTKKYCALLRGNIEDCQGASFSAGQQNGRIELKFRLDPDNRPYQMYDEQNGKTGITLWRKIREEYHNRPEADLSGRKREICTRMEFSLLTGRTHQIRLACASPHGLGHAIVGDSLYGIRYIGERMLLHAFSLEFTHPVTGIRMNFYSEPDF